MCSFIFLLLSIVSATFDFAGFSNIKIAFYFEFPSKSLFISEDLICPNTLNFYSNSFSDQYEGKPLINIPPSISSYFSSSLGTSISLSIFSISLISSIRDAVVKSFKTFSILHEHIGH